MHKWFDTPLGQSVIETEIHKCAAFIPSGYYARSLQLGFPDYDYLQGVEISRRYVADTRYPEPGYVSDQAVQSDHRCHRVYSTAESLPFPEKSHDLIALPHTLDFCDDPHAVLRQTNQILTAEGCIVITGFNLFSLFGVKNSLHRLQRKHDQSGQFYSVHRVQDWLGLLGYDLVGAGMCCYLPPVQSPVWRERMQLFEKAGDRWWPGLGGIYILVARKREMILNTPSKAERSWHRLIPGMTQPAAQPAAQRAAKIGLRLVHKS